MRLRGGVRETPRTAAPGHFSSLTPQIIDSKPRRERSRERAVWRLLHLGFPAMAVNQVRARGLSEHCLAAESRAPKRVGKRLPGAAGCNVWPARASRGKSDKRAQDAFATRSGGVRNREYGGRSQLPN